MKKKLKIYFIDDLATNHSPTSHQYQGILKINGGGLLANPKNYPPFEMGCHWAVENKEPEGAELIYEEKYFSVYRSYYEDGMERLTIIPHDIEIELEFTTLSNAELQRDFFLDKDALIEDWRE
jgi:hypothetical protein